MGPKFKQKAVSIECKKVYPSQMPTWIKSRLRDKGLSIDREALEMFVALTEGNLFVAMQSIDRLGLMEVTNNVSIQDINDCVADGAHFDLFQLTDAAMMNKKDRVFKIFSRLKSEGMQPFELMRVVNWELKNLSDLMTDSKRTDSRFRCPFYRHCRHAQSAQIPAFGNAREGTRC